MRQLFISGPAHFDRRAAIATVAPVALVPVEAFTRAAIITHKNLSLLFLISRRESHAFLFELLSFGGRLTTAFLFLCSFRWRHLCQGKFPNRHAGQ